MPAIRDLLVLGRVSNLPTVWVNVLAAWVLLELAEPLTHQYISLVLLLLAMSLLYVGGMVLNDAFDSAYDQEWRVERPIPNGRISRNFAFTLGYGLLASGVLVGALAGQINAQFMPASIAACVLAGVIVLYDVRHKHNPFAPIIMGLARMLIYGVMAAVLIGDLPAPIIYAGIALLSYTAGLTYVAKQENLASPVNWWPLGWLLVPVVYGFWLAWQMPMSLVVWLGFVVWLLLALRRIIRHAPGDIPQAVTAMIAGMALWDALILAAHQAWLLCGLALLCFGLTRLWQRKVPGT